jgi:hypothetical protein
MKASVQKELSVLINLPLWAVGRAGSLAWFHFGGHHVVPDRRIGIKDVGDYALHIDCAWTMTTSPYGQTLATDESSTEELAALDDLNLTCDEVSADDRGGFVLRFASGHLLTVAPDDDEAEEYWRLFEPHRATPHFVVGAAGIEPRDA